MAKEFFQGPNNIVFVKTFSSMIALLLIGLFIVVPCVGLIADIYWKFDLAKQFPEYFGYFPINWDSLSQTILIFKFTLAFSAILGWAYYSFRLGKLSNFGVLFFLVPVLYMGYEATNTKEKVFLAQYPIFNNYFSEVNENYLKSEPYNNLKEAFEKKDIIKMQELTSKIEDFEPILEYKVQSIKAGVEEIGNEELTSYFNQIYKDNYISQKEYKRFKELSLDITFKNNPNIKLITNF